MKLNISFKSFFINLFKKPSPIEIYTDGSHKGRWGSWAFVVVDNQKIIHEASGSERRTDSHRMEFQAVIEALKYLPAESCAVINTDSKALLDCFTKVRKRTFSNQDQVDEIDQLLILHKVSWRWVKGHHGNVYNEKCDLLCSLAREMKFSIFHISYLILIIY